MKFIPTSPSSDVAQVLLHALDEELLARYPGLPVHGIAVADFERLGGYFVVGQKEGVACGSGAFRPLDSQCAEIKRMYVVPAARRGGVARMILRHLETEIQRRGFRTIVLETGYRQPEAIALYEAEAYLPIPRYGEYVHCPNSRCYAKPASWAAPL